MATSKVTADFMVDRLEEIFPKLLERCPALDTLVVNADNGCESSGRRTQWLKRLVEFSCHHGIQIQLAYYPPYHSKYNPIERSWGVLENHWRGQILGSIEKVLGLARSMTYAGIKPVVKLVRKCYPSGDQRLALSSKNKGTDILVMTATPIPRTLALTAYGDMEVSKIDEKPAGRKPVDTLLFSNDKLEQVVAGIKRKIPDGVRVYWVCPLVEESELVNLSSAEERFDMLKASFGERVGLIHGRLKPAEKDAVMVQFKAGELDILVATTVIEVGVNVPEATVMVIEHAEHFGLSQLHQLRGRVGRGAEKSYCFLLYATPLGETAKERLNIMRDTEDGFVIAEKDLELRGGGDILGTKQSGMTEFRLADLAVHGDLLATARDDAKLIITKDAKLESERGKALKTMLYLFERDQAIQYFRSG